jgi:hypothetical protein
MTYEGLLNTNIYLRTRASSQNILGEYIHTYTTSTTPVKCRIVPIRVAERIENPGLFDDVSYTCYCLSSASIQRDSQISYAGEYYRVKEMELDSSFHHKKALLKLVT